jgi:hypothetical protein
MKTKHSWAVYFLSLLTLAPINAYRALAALQTNQESANESLARWCLILLVIATLGIFFPLFFSKDSKEPISKISNCSTNILALISGLSILAGSVSSFVGVGSKKGLSNIIHFFVIILGILAGLTFISFFISHLQKKDILKSSLIHTAPMLWGIAWLLATKSDYDQVVVYPEDMLNMVVMGTFVFFFVYRAKISMQIESPKNRRNLFMSGMFASLFAFVYEVGNITKLSASTGFDFPNLFSTITNLSIVAYILSLLLSKTPQLKNNRPVVAAAAK